MSSRRRVFLFVFSIVLTLVSVSDALAQYQWEYRAALMDPRTGGSGVEGGSASLIGNTIYVSHGRRKFDSVFLSAYDIGSNTWTHGGVTLPDASVPRSEMAGGTALGKHYAIGGRTGPTDACEEFDPGTGAWTLKAPMPGGPRGGLGAASASGRIYALGGRTGSTFGSGTILDRNEEYDAASNAWVPKAPMPIPVSDNYAAVAFGGKVFVFGGATGPSTVIADVQIYDIGANTWAIGSNPMPTARAAAMAGVIDNQIVVFGGYDGTSNLSVTEIYDPVTNMWSLGPNMLQAVSEISQGVTYDANGIYSIGTGIFGASGSVVMVLVRSSVPVLITRFAARASGSSVELTWDVWADEAIGGFRVHRTEEGRTVSGPLLSPDTRSVVDTDVAPGVRYAYRLAVIGRDGYEVVSQRETVTPPPLSTALGENVPNPFNPSTRIPFTIDREGRVALLIYDVSGRLVRTLVDRRMRPGAYGEMWDGTDDRGREVPSGTYFYRLTGEGGSQTRKAVLVR